MIKLKNEEEERARKEREIADKMREQAAASENEILTICHHHKYCMLTVGSP